MCGHVVMRGRDHEIERESEKERKKERKKERETQRERERERERRHSFTQEGRSIKERREIN